MIGVEQNLLDDDLYESVIDVFIDLYNKGLIYRGVRMVTILVALTAISDEEVIYEEQSSKLYYVRYKVEVLMSSSGSEGQIATTRPETIPGDTAVCVNPNEKGINTYKVKK